MQLLKRSAPPQYDEHLTYFTVTEAEAFRRLVARSFAAAGRDVDVYSDHIEDRGGTTFGLWNIGALCAGVDVDEWPDLIDDHVRLVTTPARELADMSRAELESALYLRLVHAGSVPDPDTPAHVRVVAPGLLEALSVDLGDSVATPSREELTAHGTIGELVARGRDNLRALLSDGGALVETVGQRGQGWFAAVTGDSPFTASLALLLPETVDRLPGEDDWGRGALVAVPSRHRLLYRPIDAPDARLALGHMLAAALRGFAGEPGALSPDVFWVRNHAWAQVTSSTRGKPRVLRGTGLREAFRSV